MTEERPVWKTDSDPDGDVLTLERLQAEVKRLVDEHGKPVKDWAWCIGKAERIVKEKPELT